MTKKQREEHKAGNQVRKARLLSLYYKQKPSKNGWMPLGGVCQNGRYTRNVRHAIAQARHVQQLDTTPLSAATRES